MAVRVHRAVRADRLVEGLAGLLSLTPADAFARELVIVPARGVERWLSQRLSHRLGPSAGGDDGVCAAVDFRSPHSLVAELTGTTEEDPWSPDALAWPVLRVLDEVLDEPWAGVLATHLGHGVAGEEGELRRGRRYAVARRLAGLFASYAAQRPALLVDWESGGAGDGRGAELPGDLLWQPELWRRVVADRWLPSPVVRHEQVVAGLRDGSLDSAVPPRLSLFGHTALSRTEAELLAALGTRREVHLWLPHPSPALWSGRQGGEGGEGHHPLLVSLGRDVRELQDLLTQVGAVDEGSLEEPAIGSDSLLHAIQADLVADRVPAAAVDVDGTVSVHACHGPARQVEVLRELLLGLLADDPTLEPRDIVVMCPDIEAYAPLVTAAFGVGDAVAGAHPGQQLRVMLADRSPVQTNPLLGVLGRLLDLADGRVEASRVLDLLAEEPVRRRFGFTDADLETIASWVAGAGIRWGFDAGHRAPYSLSAYPQNTWRFGLDRILSGVALSDDSDLWLGQTLPLDDVPSTRIGLAGRLAEALDRLQALTDGLHGSQPVPVWLDSLREGVDQLTAVPRGEEWQVAQLHRELARLAGPAVSGATTELRLADVRSLLHSQLAGRPSRASFRTGTLTVCTLTPMRSVPHRVVALLGLDDHVFPRSRARDGDDVLGRERQPGERDPRSQDRQLFLDAVLSARERLIITYTGFHESTGQPRPPAVPLREFLDVVEATTGASNIVVPHRSQPFHDDYLGARVLPWHRRSDGEPFSFDQHAVAAARAAAGVRRDAERLVDVDLGPAPVGDVSLRELLEAVTYPVRAFLSQRLGVSVPREEDEILDSLPVGFGGLDEWQVGDRILRELLTGHTAEHALHAEWRRGSLPPGRYGWRLARRIADAAAPLAQLAETSTQGIDPRAVDLDVDLGDGRRLVGTVTGVHHERLFRVGYSRLGARQRLEAWVSLAALAASGHRVTMAGVVGRGPEGDAPVRATYRRPADPLAVVRGLVAVRDEALRSPLPYGVETARCLVTRVGANPWETERELGKAWGRECRAPEFGLVWGGRSAVPAYKALAPDPRVERLAHAVWDPALAEEVE